MKVGFVSILGRPNVGKSTLLNSILDYKVSITSSKPQTTRDQIKGIYNDEDSQIVFIDTPGIHKPQQELSNNLNEASYSSVKDADVILFLTPINDDIGVGDKMIIEKIINKNPVAVITKIDESDPEKAKEKAALLKEMGFTDVIGTSVNIQQSVNHLIDFLKGKLNDGEPFYDREEITDKSMRFITKEIIRESVIERVSHEVPHSIGVLINDFEEPQFNSQDIYKIKAFIYVERNSQKGIVVGKDGSKIKEIGIDARQKIEEILGHRVHLELKVKENKNWTDDEAKIKKMGY